MWSRFAIALLPALLGAFEEPEVIPRIRGRLKAALEKLPDYTCLETVERSRRPAPGAAWQPLDTIRLQVGVIDRKEMYSWSGEQRFDGRELRELTGKGIAGNGSFAEHVRHIFLGQGVEFTARTGETIGGREVLVFDFDLDAAFSRYTLRIPPHEAPVGVRGSFAVDRETLDIRRLEVQAHEIPPDFGIARLSHRIHYAAVAIGARPVFLPASAEISVLAADEKEEHRNVIEFSGCKQYEAESKLRFDEAAPLETSAAPADPGPLPLNLRVEMELDSDIEPEKAALGDSVSALVLKPARDGERIAIPAGAVLHGRLVRLDKDAAPFPHYVVGIEFHTLEAAGARTPFSATMQQAGPASALLKQQKSMDPVFTKKRTARFDILVREKQRGSGVLLWDARQPRIKRGLKMVWLTAEP